MQAQLEDCRARGDVVAYLWASEATIYGRFGYGLASRIGEFALARDRTRFAVPFEPRGTVRLVDLEEAARCLPAALRAAARAAAGDVHAQRGLVGDAPALRRPGTAAGRPAEPGAARARRRAGRLCPLPRQAGLAAGLEQGDRHDRRGRHADGPTPRASSGAGSSTSTGRRQFTADLLPLDHPLFLLLAEPRRLRFTINDGVWVRLLDVEAAAVGAHVHGRRRDRARRRRCVWPENGRAVPRHVRRRRAHEGSADLRLGVAELGSVYLGGFRFADLARAARVEELRAGRGRPRRCALPHRRRALVRRDLLIV